MDNPETPAQQARPAYIMGAEAEDASIVARGVCATIDVKGNRSCTTSMPVHEFVLAKRRYMGLSGDIVMLPEWPVGVMRTVPYTRDDLESQYKRLEETYIHRTEGGVLKLVEEVYGKRGSGNFVRRMVEAFRRYVEWAKAQPRKPGAPPMMPMTPEIWDELCRICDPSYGSAKGRLVDDVLSVPDLELEIFDEQKTAHEAADKARKDRELTLATKAEETVRSSLFSVDGCKEHLRKAGNGMTEAQYDALAKGLAANDWKHVRLTEETWKAVGAKTPAERQVYEEMLSDYLDTVDGDPDELGNPDLGGI